MTAATETKTFSGVGRDVYQPIEGFTAVVDGQDVSFTRYTFVREGHWLLAKYPELFRPVPVQYDVAQPSSDTGSRP